MNLLIFLNSNLYEGYPNILKNRVSQEKICYELLTKKYEQEYNELKSQNIPGLYFIDMLSGNPSMVGDYITLDNPDANRLFERISLANRKNKFDRIIFDSISSLLLFSGKYEIEMLAHQPKYDNLEGSLPYSKGLLKSPEKNYLS